MIRGVNAAKMISRTWPARSGDMVGEFILKPLRQHGRNAKGTASPPRQAGIFVMYIPVMVGEVGLEPTKA